MKAKLILFILSGLILSNNVTGREGISPIYWGKAIHENSCIRIGVGAQYKISKVGFQTMIRHQRSNKLVKQVNAARISLFYQF